MSKRALPHLLRAILGFALWCLLGVACLTIDVPLYPENNSTLTDADQQEPPPERPPEPEPCPNRCQNNDDCKACIPPDAPPNLPPPQCNLGVCQPPPMCKPICDDNKDCQGCGNNRIYCAARQCRPPKQCSSDTECRAREECFKGFCRSKLP